MSIPDWLSPEQYGYAAALTATQWAWEFLRRNPRYRADWQWFHETWSALEASYGSPPRRDFFRWKQDPRAYRADDDGEPLLIECWMGERWGLYKTPPDPALSAPTLGTALRWRFQETVVPIVDAPSVLPTSGDEQWLALGFDLMLPLKAQLEAARRQLVARQRALARQGAAAPLRVKACAPHWTACLRALDGASMGASAAEIGQVLCADASDPQRTGDRLHAQARTLAEHGYRRLLRLQSQ